MTHTTLNMEMRPERIWSELNLGAKVATGVAAVALIGASLAASLFLAGAALFSALVMVIYTTVAGWRKSENVEEAKPSHSEASPEL